MVAIAVLAMAGAGCGSSSGIPAGHVSCPYERTQDCGPATGDPATDNDDSNGNGTPDAYEPGSHQDSDGDGAVDTYDDAPNGEDGYYDESQSWGYGEDPPPLDSYDSGTYDGYDSGAYRDGY